MKKLKFKRLTVKQLTVIEILVSLFFAYMLYLSIKPIFLHLNGCWGYPLFISWVWMDWIIMIEIMKGKRE